jgi:DNA invertase Pin-like site-specific DNA recombinase
MEDFMSFDSPLPRSGNGQRVKAVAYARVSRLLGQDAQLQITNIREFAAARGYDLINEYIDEGISGTTEKRKGLDELLADASKGKFNVVIVTALDRISRSTKHFLNLFSELRHYNINVISIREQLDFSSPAGSMVATVLSSVASLERQIIAERIKTSLAAKKLTAKQTGSNWRSGRPTKVTQEIIEQVLKLNATGLSVRQIAAQLNISKSSVLRVLQNHTSKKAVGE